MTYTSRLHSMSQFIKHTTEPKKPNLVKRFNAFKKEDLLERKKYVNDTSFDCPRKTLVFKLNRKAILKYMRFDA